MSYIDDALRKAQRERDGRYERFGGIIASGPAAPPRSRKRLAAGAVLVFVALGLVGALLAVSLQRPSPAKRDAPRLVAASDPAAAVPSPSAAGTPPGEGARENAVVPGKGTPPQGQPGEKTGATAAPGSASAAEVGEWFRDALAAQRRGELRRAEDLYQRVLARDPGHVESLNNVGVIYMGQKNRDKAIAVFGRAIIVKKDYVDPYYNLACLYAQTSEVEESIWYLKVAMAINGDVKRWAEKDADLRNVVASPAFKKITEGQHN